MQTIKVSEMQGAALDWLVAKCAGMWVLDSSSFIPHYELGRMRFSTDWAQGGPIIEREKITTMYRRTPGPYPEGQRWNSVIFHNNSRGWYGETPLIAAMRCYVASKLGDEVEVPDELLS